MPDTGIYAIENIMTGRIYVGQTKQSFEQRWRRHRRDLDLGCHANADLQLNWQAYGSGWFKFMVLQEIPHTAAMSMHEQAWILQFHEEGRGCYNVIRPFDLPFKLPRLPIKQEYHMKIPPFWTMSDLESQIPGLTTPDLAHFQKAITRLQAMVQVVLLQKESQSSQEGHA